MMADDEELVPLRLLTGEDNTLAIPLNKPVINYRDWSYWSALSDSGSALCSSVDSELGSTESSEELEDEDDYIAQLTHKMTLCMLQDDDNHEQENKSCPNQEEDVLVRNKYEEEKERVDRLLSPSIETTIESSIEKNPDLEFQSKHTLFDQQVQFHRLKQGHDMKPQWARKFNVNEQNRIRGRACGGFLNGQNTAPWPNLVQQTSHSGINSAMRAVFLDNQTGSRTGCSGTGVFLPRRSGNTSSGSRRKKGCTTVLIPTKVVQALKLHFDKMGCPARPNGINFQFPSQSQAVPVTSDQEICLPQEWTY